MGCLVLITWETFQEVSTMSTPIGMVDQQYDSTGTQELPKNFGSLPYTVSNNPLSTAYTRVADGVTYIFTITLDASGNEVSGSGWVKQ